MSTQQAAGAIRSQSEAQTGREAGSTRMPAVYIPHGGGPCFFMEWDPPHAWDKLRGFFEQLPQLLPEPPKAILLVSAHWETRGFRVTGAQQPGLLYDYSGFPEDTYQLRYDAPGASELATRVNQLLANAGLTSQVDLRRDWDHGVFVPLKVIYPEAKIPVVELSIEANFSPELHLKVGEALAPLRNEGVLILGSGMSYHNMRGLFGMGNIALSNEFDAWLTKAVESAPEERAKLLADWEQAPGAREAQPREDHLIPLMTVAGAGGKGKKVFEDRPMGGHLISAYMFE